MSPPTQSSQPKIAALAAVLLALTLLAACGGPAPAPVTPTGSPLEPTATRRVSPTPRPTATPAGLGIPSGSLEGITVPLWHPWTGALARALDERVAAFNRSNPWGIAVETRGLADQGDLFGAVLQAAGDAAADAPRLVIANPEQGAAWQEMDDLLADLTPYLEDPEWGLTGAEVADFVPAAWESGLAGEQRLGIPVLRSARVLFYNVTWAEELGFNTPPQHPEEFADQACTAARAINNDNNWENNGTGGWILDHDALTVLSWLNGFGSAPVGGPEEGYNFAGPRNEEALAFLRGVYDDGCAWLARLPDSPGYFARRQALFFSGSLDEIPALERAIQFAENTDEWAAIPFPAKEAPQVILFGPDLHVLAGEPEEELAGWLVARWLVSPESQAVLARASGGLPARQSALDDLLSDDRSLPEWKAAAALLENTVAAPQRADWRIARRVLEDAHRQVYAANTLPKMIPDILEQLDETIAEVVEQSR